MGAFDLSRADWQAFLQSPPVIQILGTITQVTITGSDGRCCCRLSWLQVCRQGLAHPFQAIGFQMILLPMQSLTLLVRRN